MYGIRLTSHLQREKMTSSDSVNHIAKTSTCSLRTVYFFSEWTSCCCVALQPHPSSITTRALLWPVEPLCVKVAKAEVNLLGCSLVVRNPTCSLQSTCENDAAHERVRTEIDAEAIRYVNNAEKTIKNGTEYLPASRSDWAPVTHTRRICLLATSFPPCFNIPS
jgi:hypothetical protein